MFFRNFFEQISNSNLRRYSPDQQRRFDCRANVIGVNVAVVNAVATHDNNRVTNLSPGVLEFLQLRVFKIKQEHDFVTQLADINAAVAGMTQCNFFKLLCRRAVVIIWLGQRFASYNI